MELSQFSRRAFEQAVRLYLAEAYGDGPLPAAVQQRLSWPEGETLADLAGAAVFERVPADASPADCRRLRLRLGNRVYPHMKLGVDRVPGTDEWVLVVDAHDQALVGAAPESERATVGALAKHNADLTVRIKKRWEEAGLPTFEQYVRSRLAAQGDGGAPMGG